MIIKRSRLSRLRSVFGLALVASLAATALSASSASALSTSPAAQAFSSFSGPLLFTDSTDDVIHCNSSTGSGAWDGTGTSGKASFLLRGCGYNGRVTCTSPGQASGNIVTSLLNFKVIYLDAAKTKFGLLLTPPAGSAFAQATCPFIQPVITGSVIGRIIEPALNVSSNKHILSFSGSHGVQGYQQIEGAGPKYNLNVTYYSGGMTEGLSLSSEHTMQYSNSTKFLP
jgi:hypothetical protein